MSLSTTVSNKQEAIDNVRNEMRRHIEAVVIKAMDDCFRWEESHENAEWRCRSRTFVDIDEFTEFIEGLLTARADEDLACKANSYDHWFRRSTRRFDIKAPSKHIIKQIYLLPIGATEEIRTVDLYLQAVLEIAPHYREYKKVVRIDQALKRRRAIVDLGNGHGPHS